MKTMPYGQHDDEHAMVAQIKAAMELVTSGKDVTIYITCPSIEFKMNIFSKDIKQKLQEVQVAGRTLVFKRAHGEVHCYDLDKALHVAIYIQE